MTSQILAMSQDAQRQHILDLMAELRPYEGRRMPIERTPGERLDGDTDEDRGWARRSTLAAVTDAAVLAAFQEFLDATADYVSETLQPSIAVNWPLYHRYLTTRTRLRLLLNRAKEARE